MATAVLLERFHTQRILSEATGRCAAYVNTWGGSGGIYNRSWSQCAATPLKKSRPPALVERSNDSRWCLFLWAAYTGQEELVRYTSHLNVRLSRRWSSVLKCKRTLYSRGTPYVTSVMYELWRQCWITATLNWIKLKFQLFNPHDSAFKDYKGLSHKYEIVSHYIVLFYCCHSTFIYVHYHSEINKIYNVQFFTHICLIRYSILYCITIS